MTAPGHGEDGAPRAPRRQEALVQPPASLDLSRLWNAAWAQVRLRHPGPQRVSQDELLQLLECTAHGEGWVVRLRHVFDADFASQYDATESHELVLELRGDTVEVRSWRPCA